MRTDVRAGAREHARGIPFDKEPTMNTLLHTDFARRLADDRRASVHVERRVGALRRAVAALPHRAARPARAAQPESPAAASA